MYHLQKSLHLYLVYLDTLGVKFANYVGNLLTFDFLRTTSKVQKVALHILLVKQVWLYDAAKKRDAIKQRKFLGPSATSSSC